MVEKIELVLKTCLMDLTPTCTIGSYGMLSLLGTGGWWCWCLFFAAHRPLDSCHLNIVNRESLQLVNLRGSDRTLAPPYWVSRRPSIPYEPIVTTTRKFYRKFPSRSTDHAHIHHFSPLLIFQINSDREYREDACCTEAKQAEAKARHESAQ